MYHIHANINVSEQLKPNVICRLSAKCKCDVSNQDQGQKVDVKEDGKDDE